MRRVALIVNPHASRVDDESTAAVRDVLARVADGDDDDGRSTAATRSSSRRCCAATSTRWWSSRATAGFNEVLNGLRDPLPVGFVPGGGASVLPRALGLPRDPVEAAAGARRRDRGRAARAGSRSGGSTGGASPSRRASGSTPSSCGASTSAAGRPTGSAPAQRLVRARGRQGGVRAARPLRAGARDRGPRPGRVRARRQRRSVLVRGPAAAAHRAAGPLRPGPRPGRAAQHPPGDAAALRPLRAARPRPGPRGRRRSTGTTSTGSRSAATSRCRCRPTARTSATWSTRVFEAERDAVAVLG